MNNYKSTPHWIIVGKLVSGVLSIIISATRILQFCNLAISVIHTGYEMSNLSLYLCGFTAVIITLVAGILSIATRNNNNIGSDLAVSILYFAASVFHILDGPSDIYPVLCVWSILCACLALVSMAIKGHDNRTSKD